jgi:CubicO group peptidase (beta-lactamase class C family)
MQFRVLAAALAVTTLVAFSPLESAELPTGPSGTIEHSDHPLDRADLQAWLDGLLPYAMKSGDIAGAVVAVVKDGRVLFQQGYGYADIDKRIPMDPERTMVRAGSTSKLFTWTAVMQLVEQGKIDLDRDISEYLDFKVSAASAKPVTMRDLMNHESGFEEGLKDILAIDPRGLQSTQTYLKRHPRPMLFTPGEVPAYSNYGAALAGYIVERVSAEPFEHYAERHLFLPLGMMHTTFDQPLPERFKALVSQGYRTASTPAQPYELIIPRPAGSVTTTAADMTRFMLAHLQQGRLGDYQMLGSQTERLMQSPSETSLPGFGTMAHGFLYQVKNGHTVIGHGGDTVFFHTEFDLLPEDGVGIVYTFNSRGSDNAVYGLRKALFDQFMDRYFPGSPPPDPASLASATRDAQRIAGRYVSSRRVEHGFLSVFYLLQQEVIRANPDGTIAAPRTLEPGEATFQEVAPDIWREVGDTRQLALRNVAGVKTVTDSDDPTSVLQAARLSRSAPLNLSVLLGSLLILGSTVLLWPISWLVKRRYSHVTDSTEVRRLRLLIRAAASFDVLYLVGWMLLLTPVLNVRLWVYSDRLDPLVRTLQLAGPLVIVAALVGIWCLWRLSRLQKSRIAWVGNTALAAALLGIVWIGLAGQLISFNLNY